MKINVTLLSISLLNAMIISNIQAAELSVDTIPGGGIDNSRFVFSGSPFAVDIIIDDASGLAGFQFELGFDGNVTPASAITSGDIFGISNTLPIDNTISPNSASFAEVTLASGGVDVNNPVVLATVSFDAADPGVSMLDLTNTVLADTFGFQILPVIEIDGQVIVIMIANFNTFALSGNAAAFRDALVLAIDAGDGAIVADLLVDLENGDVSSFLNIADAASPSVSASLTQGAREAHNAMLSVIENRFDISSFDPEIRPSAGDPDRYENGLWVQGFGGVINQNKDNDVAGYDGDTASIMVGYDHIFGYLQTGVVYSYGQTEITDNRFASDDNDIDSHSVSLYGQYYNSDGLINTILSYSKIDYNMRRRSPLAGQSFINSDTEGDLFSAKMSLGYDLKLNSVVITPHAGVNYSTLTIDNFTEKGGLNLKVAYEDVDELESELGLTLSMQKKLQNWAILPSVDVSWLHEFLDEEVTAKAQFAGHSFTQKGFDTDQDQVNINAGVGIQHNSGLVFFLNYNGRFGNNFSSQAGRAGLRYIF